MNAVVVVVSLYRTKKPLVQHRCMVIKPPIDVFLLRRCARSQCGTAAVEFAIVVPVFLFLLFGIVSLGSYLAVVHGVQQLAAEAARVAVAGLDDTERNRLALGYIDSNVGFYPLLSPSRLTLDRSETNAASGVFALTLRYDLSGMFVFSLPAFAPAPPRVVVRSAAIQRGGY
jgi:Flp pilus assembly protein TadG